MRRVLAIWLLLGAPAAAQTEASDPDWPCVQRLVPTLGAAAYWGGPEPAEGTGWRDDPAASAVVAAAAPRDVDVERGTALLQAYLAAQPPEARLDLAPDPRRAETVVGAVVHRVEGLRRYHHTVARLGLRAKPGADVLLAAAEPVRVGRVQRRDAHLPRGVEQRVR